MIVAFRIRNETHEMSVIAPSVKSVLLPLLHHVLSVTNNKQPQRAWSHPSSGMTDVNE